MRKVLKNVDVILADLNKGAPNFFKDIFSYSQLPQMIIDGIHKDISIPSKLYISDSTFREGQQAVSYLGLDRVLKIFDYLHFIDNNSGTVKYSEFFVYTSYHKKCIEKCLGRGYKFPKVVAWVRAKPDELYTVKDLGLDEAGILMSCSDYHIYKKLKKNRIQVAKEYLETIERAFELGLKPRVHLEDITRADIERFVVPFIKAVLIMAEEAKAKVCFKLCDTLGLGVPFDFVKLPRSVPKLVRYIIEECGLLDDQLEWHGHNDFYKAHDNAACAWLFGAAIVNSTLRGVGERTGIAAFEAMVFELLQIKSEDSPGLDMEALREMLEFIEKEGILR